MWELLVHLVDGSKIHGSIFTDCSMRAAAGLNSHNAFRRQCLCPCENKLVLFCIDVVSNDVNVVCIAKAFAKRFNKCRFSRANRATDADAQRMCCWVRVSNVCHERNNLVYCVSCDMEARSTMNPADPRSSIVYSLICSAASSTVSSSSAIASCPSV